MPLLAFLAPLILLLQQPGSLSYRADHIFMESVSTEGGKTKSNGPFGTRVTLTHDTISRTWLVVFTGQEKQNMRFSWHENAARTGIYFLDHGEFPWKITFSRSGDKIWKAECEQADELGNRAVFLIRRINPVR